MLQSLVTDRITKKEPASRQTALFRSAGKFVYETTSDGTVSVVNTASSCMADGYPAGSKGRGIASCWVLHGRGCSSIIHFHVYMRRPSFNASHLLFYLLKEQFKTFTTLALKNW